MIHLIRFEPPRTTPLDAAMVEIDIDPAAERYVVMDRKSLGVLWHGASPTTGNAKIRVPLSYLVGYDLMVLNIDDVGSPSYYVAGNDKVQAELVDARTVVLNP